jgi:hypothetical protein
VDDGRSIPEWAGRRRADALERVRAEGARTRAVCVLCQLPIDYSLRYPHPQSCSVQHLLSRRRFPELTWEPSNMGPAHLDCNKSAGPDAAGVPDLGVSAW